MDDEDSIDLEALQAQIDMSMAFAENMVSSWVKPSPKLSRRSNRDFEAELKEHMRRPPRLGVGAAIPESAHSTRDIARLKGQLIGKGNKRPREDEISSREKDGTDSEGETKRGLIKKKARVDPFTKDGKKKNKHKTSPEETMFKRKPLAQGEVEKELEESVNTITEGAVVPASPLATSKGGKYKNNDSIDSSHYTVQTPTSPSGVLVNTSSSIPLNELEQSTPRSTDRKVIESPSPAIPLQSHRQAQTSALLKFPLLNLRPVDDDNSDHDVEAESDAHDSPKKKRRRKKKKKKDGASASTTFEVPALSS
ncbi:hypothetical protein C0992_004445 [Termitomyces sp. T32_za158]|nr:hypothetical protein C0992_004445 [Termitomyces sp. T32_za158]